MGIFAILGGRAMNRNAERQRNYRQRHLGAGTKAQLQVIVSLDTQLALKRLCRHYALTQADLLEQVLAGAQRRVLAGMTVAAQTQFLDAVTP